MGELITISIPTYRRPSLLLQCLHSCFIQDYRPLEIDISDNSPGDDSERLLKTLSVPDGITIRYWRNQPALTMFDNINKLFAEARGDRLLVLHDDDALLPGAIQALDEAFAKSPDIITTYGMQECTRPLGETSPMDTDHHNNISNRTPDHAGLHYDLMTCALWRQLPCDAFLIRTDVARSVGYRSFAEVGLAVDTDFGVRMAQDYPGKALYFVDQMISQYRLSPDGQREAGRNTTWPFYAIIRDLPNLSAAQQAARDQLLRQIAQESVLETALSRHRKDALGIFFSRYYPRRESMTKSIYHLSLIAAPQIRLVKHVMALPGGSRTWRSLRGGLRSLFGKAS